MLHEIVFLYLTTCRFHEAFHLIKAAQFTVPIQSSSVNLHCRTGTCIILHMFKAMTHKKSVQSKSENMKKEKPSSEQETRRSKSHHFKSEDDSKWFIGVCGRPDRIASQKRASTNLLAKESGKSRQRHKDVNAALLSASEPACDPQPNAFDYINYCESGGASGTDLTAIHNMGPPQTDLSGSGYLRLLVPPEKKQTIPYTHCVSHMKENTQAMHFSKPCVLLRSQEIHTAHSGTHFPVWTLINLYILS